MAIVVAALLTRMMIPTGYMPMVENGHVVIALCGEQNAGAAMPGMSSMKGMSRVTGQPGGHSVPDHDKDGSCGFGGLSLASLAGIDPVLVALAVLFIVTTVFRRPRSPRIAAPPFLWPHRTGPPLRA